MQDNIEWITVHGTHIPVKKGQSKKDAIDSFFDARIIDMSDKEYETFVSERDKFLTDKEREHEEKEIQKGMKRARKTFVKLERKTGSTKVEAEKLWDSYTSKNSYTMEKQRIELGNILF